MQDSAVPGAAPGDGRRLRRLRSGLVVGFLVATVACRPDAAGPRAGPGPRIEDDDRGHRRGGNAADHVPLSAGSSVEELSWISRVVRETRANLMTRLTLSGAVSAGRAARASGPYYATLHHPQLALLEAILAEPKKARQSDRAWLRQHLLTTHVELRGPRPLPLEATWEELVLRDEHGRRYSPLYLSEQRSDTGWVGRVVFEVPPWTATTAPGELTLQVRLRPRPVVASAPVPSMTARWALSRRDLPRFDRLPVAAAIAPLRTLRQARYAALLGDLPRARQLAAATGNHGASWRRSRAELTRALVALASSSAAASPEAPRREDEPDRDANEPGPIAPEGAATAPQPPEPWHLALRRALLRRLLPAARAGLVAAPPLTRALERLRAGSREISTAVFDFDRSLADALMDALDPQSPVAVRTTAETTTIALARALDRSRHRSRDLSGSNTVPSPGAVQRELRLRVARANAALRPQRVALRGPAPSTGTKPRLRARAGQLEVVAPLRLRLGAGWLHPGLPTGLRYRVEFFDDAAASWARRVRRATSAVDLRALARDLLLSEVRGSSPAAVSLAAAGLVQIDGERALAAVQPAIDGGTPVAAAAALRGLAALRGRSAKVDALVRRAARSTAAPLRAAAMTVAGRLDGAGMRSLLQAGLNDADWRVAVAALEPLLRQGRGVDRARGWILGADDGSADVAARGRAVLALIADMARPPAALAPDLQQLLRSSAPSPVAVRALTALGAPAARPLQALYQRAVALRGPILVAARAALQRGRAGATALVPLLRSAAGAEDVALRRLAVLALAEQPRGARDLLERALQDEDPEVQLAAHVGLARLGRSVSLLALGGGARGSCTAREIVIATLSRAMDAASRAGLLADTLQSACSASLHRLAWRLALQPPRGRVDDAAISPTVLRLGLGHQQRGLRVQAALATLGARDAAAVGDLPWTVSVLQRAPATR